MKRPWMKYILESQSPAEGYGGAKVCYNSRLSHNFTPNRSFSRVVEGVSVAQHPMLEPSSLDKYQVRMSLDESQRQVSFQLMTTHIEMWF